ncbi:MAG: phosphatidate cytidylyltransferase [Planctomycetes bacterium]|nr:phosphatidate cytidylyltransferase [Planctomycetota bacterium]
MLRYRLIFGPLMLAALVLILFLDNSLGLVDLTGTWAQRFFMGKPYLPAGLLMLAVFIVLIVLTAREMCAIMRAKGMDADPFIVALSGVTGCVLIYIIPLKINSQATTAIVATLMSVLFLLAIVKNNWLKRDPKGAVMTAGITMFSFVYMGILPGFYVAIRRWHDAWVVAAILLIVKCCDIGAYFTGRAIGRHKLIPWLSPGKTWEGLFGGVLLSAVVATGLAALGNHLGVEVRGLDKDSPRAAVQLIFPLWAAFLSGAAMGALGQFGDLIASMFKRDAGIKDSGSAVPGFGGLLDIIDSPIVVAPLAYWLLVLAAHMSKAAAVAPPG